MRFVYLAALGLSIFLCSCGKGKDPKKDPSVDTNSVDTASVEQLEQELKDLEKQSARTNEKIDSIDNLLNE